jgi:hypothetical protein
MRPSEPINTPVNRRAGSGRDAGPGQELWETLVDPPREENQLRAAVMSGALVQWARELAATRHPYERKHLPTLHSHTGDEGGYVIEAFSRFRVYCP